MIFKHGTTHKKSSDERNKLCVYGPLNKKKLESCNFLFHLWTICVSANAMTTKIPIPWNIH